MSHNALDYDISFNASKSNFLVNIPNSKHMGVQMNNCYFSVGGTPLARVDIYVYLGHIINCQLNDNDDIMHKRNRVIGQSNNVMCYFNKLDLFVRIKLFKSYCSSMYGCELWSSNDNNIEDFCVAWRKALRRVSN